MHNTIVFNNRPITPSKVVCVGRNYVEHIRELNNTLPEQRVVFHKPNSAISLTLLAFHQEPLHFETELCFLVEGGEYAGVGLGLDLTKRTLQSQLKSQGLPWERAKAFDGSVCFTPFISMPTTMDSLFFTLHVDGHLQQHGKVEQMIHSPSAILNDIKSYTTLRDGDIVMTGTPKGVAEVVPGAEYHVSLGFETTVLLEHRWIAKTVV